MFNFLSRLARLYQSIPNRLLAFIIFLLSLVGLATGTWWYFVENNASLHISLSATDNPNLTGATVSLEKAGTPMFITACNASCDIADIPPFAYTLVVKSNGYNTVKRELLFQRGEKKQETVALNRNVELSTYHVPDSSEVLAFVKNRNAILSESGATDRVIVGRYKGTAYFLEPTIPQKLMARDGEVSKLIMTFPSISEKVSFVWSDSEGIGLFNAGKEHILFDAETAATSYIQASSDTKNISLLENGDIKLVTPRGAEILTKGEKTAIAHPFYDDFVALPKGGILALIRAESSSKKTAIGFSKEYSTLLVIDRGSGKREILLRSDTRLAFLGYDGSSYFATGEDGTKYAISNLPKN